MYGVDCRNIQYEGGVSKKNVKDTVGDTSRTKIFKLGEYGQKLRRLPTIQFAHDFLLLIKRWNRYFRKILFGFRYFLAGQLLLRLTENNNDGTFRH